MTLTITSAAPFDIYSPTVLDVTTAAGQLLVGETLHRWLPAFEVGDIVLHEGIPTPEDPYYEDTITTYATRGILYISDGRVVLDEEFGLTADGFTYNAGENVEYKAYLALKISDVIRAANVRQGNSSKAEWPDRGPEGKQPLRLARFLAKSQRAVLPPAPACRRSTAHDITRIRRTDRRVSGSCTPVREVAGGG